MSIKRLQLEIRGIVQGVCYRAYSRDRARRLGLTGWVQNWPDGSVRLVAEGPEEALRELESWCRQGPPGGRVDQVEPRWQEAAAEFSTFSIRY